MVIKSIFLREEFLNGLENKINAVFGMLELDPKQIIKIDYAPIVKHDEEIIDTVMIVYNDTIEEKEEYSRTDTLGQYKKVFKD